jgi:hypothetical protein
MNIHFEGMICEIQMHAAGHCALKGEQHACYELYRSVGLVEDINGFDKKGAIANNGPLQQQKPWLVTTVEIAFLRCWFVFSLALFAGNHASLGALERGGEKGEWARQRQGLSVAGRSLLAPRVHVRGWPLGHEPGGTCSIAVQRSTASLI